LPVPWTLLNGKRCQVLYLASVDELLSVARSLVTQLLRLTAIRGVPGDQRHQYGPYEGQDGASVLSWRGRNYRRASDNAGDTRNCDGFAAPSTLHAQKLAHYQAVPSGIASGGIIGPNWPVDLAKGPVDAATGARFDAACLSGSPPLRKTTRDGADHRSLDTAADRLFGLDEHHHAVRAAVQHPGDVDVVRSRNSARARPHEVSSASTDSAPAGSN
jgi:hypothetical protein